jgi:hypothetical protein
MFVKGNLNLCMKKLLGLKSKWCSLNWVLEALTHSQFLEGLKCESQIGNIKRARNRGTLPDSQHFGGVEGCG